MKWKLETETNKTLDLLDVTIKREQNETATIEIYRKPTESDLVIRYDQSRAVRA